MFIIFNILIIGLVLLIAYWWANQGLFSALLHLLCVIAAGAIALAVWEPLVTGLLLRGSFFDNYAWGLGLVVPFILTLFVLRVIFDKTIGANVDLPRWANLTFGFGAGLAAGILTMGIFMTGAGFIQSHRNIMGFTGYARSREQRGQITPIQSMWLPVHSLTADFYSMLSVGSLKPDFEGTPLRHFYPELDRVSASLFRDTFAEGKGKTTMRPGDASIERVLLCEACPQKRLAVAMVFESGARDYGEQLTLSSSQIRLIGRATGWATSKVAHPVEFTQYSGHYKFDDVSHYVSSEPGQQRAYVILEFNLADLGGQTPRFLQVRGIRYQLPQPVNYADQGSYMKEVTGGSTASTGTFEVEPNGINITPAIRIAQDIRPIQVSMNQLPAGIQTAKVGGKNWISGGDAEFVQGGERPGRNLALEGILEPKGTRIVQVDVSRSSSASIYKELLRELAGEAPLVQLVDTQKRGYVPIGYIWNQPNGRTRIKVDFEKYVRILDGEQIPILPTADTHKLKLLFMVTENATLAGMTLGNATVGTCEILVPPAEKPASTQPEQQQNFGGETAG